MSVVGEISLTCPFEYALSYIQSLDNIANYEPKISRSITQIESSHAGRYSTFGSFAGVPWQGKFEYELHDRGFHSYMVEGVMANAMQGGFILLPTDHDQCQLWHYEEYKIPAISTYLLRVGGKQFIQSAMQEELHKIQKQLIGDKIERCDHQSFSVTWLDHGLFPDIVHRVDWTVLVEKIRTAQEHSDKKTRSNTSLAPI